MRMRRGQPCEANPTLLCTYTTGSDFLLQFPPQCTSIDTTASIVSAGTKLVVISAFALHQFLFVHHFHLNCGSATILEAEPPDTTT